MSVKRKGYCYVLGIVVLLTALSVVAIPIYNAGASAEPSNAEVDKIFADRAQDISSSMHGTDKSFAWRVHKWRGTAAMAIAG